MNSFSDQIAGIERERDAARQRIHELVAKVAGLDAQIDALRSGVRSGEPLAELKLADAVEHVMRSEGRVMSPTGIHEALIAGCRHDQLTSIGGTLQHLKRRGRVVSVGRSRWRWTA